MADPDKTDVEPEIEPASGEATGESESAVPDPAPPAGAAPETQAEQPAPPVEDTDPEYDFGDGYGKVKHSTAREAYAYAVQAQRERAEWEAKIKSAEEREARIAKLGGGKIEEVAAFFDSLDPAMRPYYLEHLAKTTQEFRKQSPVGSIASEIQDLRSQVKAMNEWKEQEVKQRESFFAEQRKQNLSAAFKAEKGRDPSKYELAGLVSVEKEEPGKDGRFYVRALYGGPATPTVRTGGPGKAGAPSKVREDELSMDEIKARQEAQLRAAGFFKS